MVDAVIREKLAGFIRDVPDFPKPGIVFRDITPLLGDPDGLRAAVRAMGAPFAGKHVEAVVGAESRGFIFATALAEKLNCGFVPVRKPGKLPAKTIAVEYDLEYGTDKLEIHTDAIKPGEKVLIVDDLLATGGTMEACCKLVEQSGGEIVGLSFLIELAYLNGRAKFDKYDVASVIAYDAE